MHKRQRICPDSQLVNERIRNVIGSVKPNDGGEKSPSAESSGRERGYGTLSLHRIDSGGIDGGGVGLDAVSDGDEGDLRERGR